MDGGKTWNLREDKLLFGAFFFLSPKIKEHQSEIDTVVDAVSNFGGLMEFFIIVFGFIGQTANRRIVMSKLVQSLYYSKKDAPDKNESCLDTHQIIKFSWIDQILMNFKVKSSIIFEKGQA